MKNILMILGIVALLCAPISITVADGDLQTLAPLTDEVVVVDMDDKIKQYYVVNCQ